jgi:hypothetical protein
MNPAHQLTLFEVSYNTVLFGRCSVRISTGTLAIVIEVICDFPQYLQANSGVVPWLGHRHFLPNHFQLIIHLSFYHPTLRYPRRILKQCIWNCVKTEGSSYEQNFFPLTSVLTFCSCMTQYMNPDQVIDMKQVLTFQRKDSLYHVKRKTLRSIQRIPSDKCFLFCS